MKSDYAPDEVKACRKVLVELIHIFGEIKDEMVIIGGWTPSLLIPQTEIPHIGPISTTSLSWKDLERSDQSLRA